MAGHLKLACPSLAHDDLCQSAIQHLVSELDNLIERMLKVQVLVDLSTLVQSVRDLRDDIKRNSIQIENCIQQIHRSISDLKEDQEERDETFAQDDEDGNQDLLAKIGRLQRRNRVLQAKVDEPQLREAQLLVNNRVMGTGLGTPRTLGLVLLNPAPKPSSSASAVIGSRVAEEADKDDSESEEDSKSEESRSEEESENQESKSGEESENGLLIHFEKDFTE